MPDSGTVLKICGACHKLFDGDTYRCPKCLETKRKNDIYRRKQRKKDGKCTECGEPRENTNCVMCKSCRTKYNKRDKLRAKANKEFKNKLTITNLVKELKLVLKECEIDKKTNYIIHEQYRIRLELMRVEP